MYEMTMYDIEHGFNLEKDMDKTAAVTLTICTSGFSARKGGEIKNIGYADDWMEYWEDVAFQYGFDSYEHMCEELEEEGIYLDKNYGIEYPISVTKKEVIEAVSIKDLERQLKEKLKDYKDSMLDEINDLQELDRTELGYEKIFPVEEDTHVERMSITGIDDIYEPQGMVAIENITYRHQVGEKKIQLEDEDLFQRLGSMGYSKEESKEIVEGIKKFANENQELESDIGMENTISRKESLEISCRIPELLLWKERVGEKDLAEEKEEANVTVAGVGKKDCFRENIMAEEKAKEKGNRNEKLEQMEQIIQDIADGWDKDPALMAEALEFGEKFHNYSIKNQMLIYAQNPYAQYVASFNKWNELGSKITKGEHGLKVFVPVKATYLETIDEVTGEPALVPLRYATAQQKKAYKEGEIKGHETMRFKAGTVFDISQTDYPKEKYPELFNMGYSKEESRQIVEGMIDFSEVKLDCPVDIKDLSSITLRGCYYPGYNRIHLNDKMEDTAKMSTLSHELGHAMIHREYSEKSTHRKEFEADAVSILISSHFGEEITDTRKNHFVSHYNALKEELANSDQEFDLHECLSDAVKVYKEHIDDLDQCVQKVIERDKAKQKDVYAETAEDRLCKAYVAERPVTFEHSKGRER